MIYPIQLDVIKAVSTLIRMITFAAKSSVGL